MTTSTNRSGPLSAEEKDFITLHCDEMGYEEIAREIRRNPETVKTYIKKVLKRNVSKIGSNLSATIEISKTPIWAELQQQFSDDELRMFIYHWTRIIGQFKDDTLPTEELQVIEYIKLELLANRALKEINENAKKIKELKIELANHPPFSKESQSIEQQIGQYTIASSSLDSVNRDILVQKMKLFQELKSTRADRIKSIESSKESMIGWMRELTKNTKMKKELGEYMEKMRIAIDLEKVRLMQNYKYLDGEVEAPLLNSETIELEENEET